MENFRQQLGQKIREMRERLGFSQQDLAAKAGFSAHQIISAIEKGEREVKTWELVTLAKVLKLSITELLFQGELPAIPQVLWRKIPQQEQQIKEAEFLKHCQDYYDLEQLCCLPAFSELPHKKFHPEFQDYSDVEQMASQVLQEFDLGARPSDTLERILENNYRVKIWYTDLGEDGSAASTIGSFGPAILMNRRESPWRRNYNFAHELFHLLTWHSIPADWQHTKPELWSKIEKLANAFASYLLLPAEQATFAAQKCFKDNNIDHIDLVKIARGFSVSTEALLYRLLNSRLLSKKTVKEVLNDPKFRNIDRLSMAEHWKDSPAISERYVLLAFTAYKKGKISRTRLAQHLETSLTNLTNFLLEYGLDDRQDYETKVRAA
jgi:Zn-dependent peptidase ImmA (M78 family)/DNA-binding XRE family transcriptional regulator